MMQHDLCSFCLAPDAPQQLSTTNIESTLIELSWMPPPADAHDGEMIYYIITYIEIQTGTNTTVTSFETEISLGNLHPYYDYIITIAAFTVEVGPSSLPITVQTIEDGKQYAVYKLLRDYTL